MVDLAKIYAAGENILTSRQNRALNQQALDPNSPANMLAMQKMDLERQKFQQGQQKFTEEQLLGNTELGFKAASEVANNPVTAKMWIPILQQRGIMDPSVRFEGNDLETIRNVAVQLRDTYGQALQDYQRATRKSQLLTPEEMAQKQAIAQSGKSVTNVNVDAKTIPSIAKEVGGILESSRTKASGAIKMFQNAQMIDQALQSGEIYAGPGATLRQAMAQIGSMLGFGGTDKVNRTRQVIRALASSAVEARKELAGQGQVTENEAKAVEKAMSGDINELTIGELRLLSDLNKRAAQLTIQQHQSYLENIPQGAEGLRGFFNVRGADDVMNYQPNPVRQPVQQPVQQQENVIDWSEF